MCMEIEWIGCSSDSADICSKFEIIYASRNLLLLFVSPAITKENMLEAHFVGHLNAASNTYPIHLLLIGGRKFMHSAVEFVGNLQ